jgi:hypothetical protein
VLTNKGHQIAGVSISIVLSIQSVSVSMSVHSINSRPAFSEKT